MAGYSSRWCLFAWSWWLHAAHIRVSIYSISSSFVVVVRRRHTTCICSWLAATGSAETNSAENLAHKDTLAYMHASSGSSQGNITTWVGRQKIAFESLIPFISSIIGLAPLACILIRVLILEIHIGDLRGKYQFHGLDITEMRGLWHWLPEWKGDSEKVHTCGQLCVPYYCILCYAWLFIRRWTHRLTNR